MEGAFRQRLTAGTSSAFRLPTRHPASGRSERLCRSAAGSPFVGLPRQRPGAAADHFPPCARGNDSTPSDFPRRSQRRPPLLAPITGSCVRRSRTRRSSPRFGPPRCRRSRHQTARPGPDSHRLALLAAAARDAHTWTRATSLRRRPRRPGSRPSAKSGVARRRARGRRDSGAGTPRGSQDAIAVPSAPGGRSAPRRRDLLIICRLAQPDPRRARLDRSRGTQVNAVAQSLCRGGAS